MPNPIYLKTSLYDGRITKHYLYGTWKNIKTRCFNSSCKDYKHYGKIGITIFQEWINNSAAFLIWIDNTLGKRPDGYSLDRIDPHGNYEPDNLRWADTFTQATNIKDPQERARKCSENNGAKKPEARNKISEKAKNRQKKTCEHCGKLVDAGNYAKSHGDKCLENPKNFGVKRTGKPLSDEHKQALKQAAKKKPKKVCPFCQRSFDAGNYAQHHGERCSMNPERN